ncbi:MAG: NAD(P)H:quinone oxidoreductase [Alphaproteobacteria bacterium]
MKNATRILVLYYSGYGHVEKLAEAIAEGVREVEGTEAVIKRVPELMPEDIAEKAGVKLDQSAAVADPAELPEYDAIVVGTPTRFGNMAAQMRNFWDQTGAHWMSGKLIGKVGSVFTSTGTGGGNETTIITTHLTMLHQGMVIVGLPYSAKELTDLSEVLGGSPYGAATIAGPENDRTPHAKELSMARQQGHYVADIARKLAA